MDMVLLLKRLTLPRLEPVLFVITFLLSVCEPNFTTGSGSDQLLRIIPSSGNDLQLLHTTFQILQMDVWHEPRNSSKYFDVRASQQQARNLRQVLQLLEIDAEVIVSDLHQKSERIRQPAGGFDWFDYHSLDDIYSWMRTKASQHAEIASTLVIGQSIEGRPLLGLRIAHERNLPIVVIEAGVHAREWIGPPTALWFANQALAPNSQLQIARSFEWHIFPTLNPDGYVYSYTTDRWWRKNRNKRYSSCMGVDLNRNFPFQWERGGYCGEMYPGSGPSSESETAALAYHLSSVSNTGRAKVFISLHSYGQYLMYPWAYTRRHPFSGRHLHDVAQQAATALSKRHGTAYSVGSVATTIYRVGGSSLDYAYSLNIPYAFVFELRGGAMSASSPGGFDLPRTQIIPTAQETYDAVLVILQRASTR